MFDEIPLIKVAKPHKTGFATFSFDENNFVF